MRLIRNATTVAMIVVACGIPASEVTRTPTTPETASASTALHEFTAARQRWSAAGLDSYRFKFQNDCGECDPSQSVARQVVVWDNEATTPQQATVASLFTRVETAIRDGRDVVVAYHPEFGHPTEISIDMETRTYDGGTHLLIRDLTPDLPGDEVSLAALQDAHRLWESQRPLAYEFRNAIGCDCPLAGTILTQVNDGRIVDWKFEFIDGDGAPISPITIDDMFEDLTRMFSSAEGVVESGIRFTGSAAYDPKLGYPVWVGLDIEVLDPDSELAFLPPRLVFSVEDFRPIEPADSFSAPPDAQAARLRWVEAGFASYEYQLTAHDIKNASFSEPYTITVEDGAVIAVEYQGQPADDVEVVPTLTIDGLFDLVEEQISGGADVEGIYHESLGYPVFLVIWEPNSSEISLAISIDALTPAP